MGRHANFFRPAALTALCMSMSWPCAAESGFRGPVEARVLDVHDGDTFLAEALVWPGHTVTVSVRVRGIDAPEIRSRCDAERLAASRARDGLAALMAAGPVSISNVAGAKYYGRVLADVVSADGLPIAAAMLARGLARPYSGGRRDGWCN